MSFAWKTNPSGDPAFYAKNLLRNCGIKEPPICEKAVTDFLELEIKEISLNGYGFADSDLHEALKTCCSWLKRGVGKKSEIWVYKNIPLGRKRLSIFHECGHEVIPWHEKIDYCCEERIDLVTQKQTEKEAYKFAVEAMMPRDMFIEDAMSLNIGIAAIEQLKDRYIGSLEATANRYVSTHLNPCGIVMVEQPKDHKLNNIRMNDSHYRQSKMFSSFEDNSFAVMVEEKKKYPLQVKYSVKSHNFPKFIRPGTPIEEDNLIFDSWITGRRLKTEIPASVFGSSAKWAYNAECLPLGKNGMIMVLLWLSDRHYGN